MFEFSIYAITSYSQTGQLTFPGLFCLRFDFIVYYFYFFEGAPIESASYSKWNRISSLFLRALLETVTLCRTLNKIIVNSNHNGVFFPRRTTHRGIKSYKYLNTYDNSRLFIVYIVRIDRTELNAEDIFWISHKINILSFPFTFRFMFSRCKCGITITHSVPKLNFSSKWFLLN